MNESPANLHVLRGPEHAAMERLIRVSEMCATAREFLDRANDDIRASSKQGAVTTVLALGTIAPKLGAALVGSATDRPGASAQLSRVSKDAERMLREFPPFPDSHRVANVAGGRRVIEDTLGDLLRDTALELHDIDLSYGVNDAGEHVFTWREESPRIVEVLLLEGLMLKMELMLMSDARLGFEHAAAAWWFKQSTIEWPSELENGLAGWRTREWAVADQVLPSLGVTAAEALPYHELWTPLSARQRSLVRSFAASVPGLFVTRKITAEGAIVEDVFDGRRFELISDFDSPPDHALHLGRLIPRDRGVYLASPGTVAFALSIDLPNEIVALLREHASRRDRAQYAELLIGRLHGATPKSDRAPDLTPASAAEMLEQYERSRKAANMGKTFRVGGAVPQPPDEATRAWIDLLRERAAEAG